jgi:hypothetical protein
VFSNTVAGVGQEVATTRASGAPEGPSYSTAEFAAVQDCVRFTARYSRQRSEINNANAVTKTPPLLGAFKDNGS